MGRFCNGLMTAFRVIQLLLSLVALGCGGYITYEMYSMSSSAQQLQSSIECLFNSTASEASTNALCAQVFLQDDHLRITVQDLDGVLNPVLQVLEGTPVRALILTAASLWSICAIVYLLVAQRAKNESGINKRSRRVPLEFITLIFWMASIVCAAMLAMEYGSVALAGGAELKITFDTVQDTIENALKQLFTDRDDKNIVRTLAIVDDVCTIGVLSVLAVISSCICGSVSFVSLILACCISGKQKKQSHLEHGSAEYLIPGDGDKKATFTVTQVSSPASWYTNNSPLHYHAVSTDSPGLR